MMQRATYIVGKMSAYLTYFLTVAVVVFLVAAVIVGEDGVDLWIHGILKNGIGYQIAAGRLA